MSISFQLQPVWSNQDFFVHKGVLDAQCALPGAELGDGLIYYAGLQRVTHRLARNMSEEQTVLGQTARGRRVLWNGGEFTEIVNPGDKPIDLCRVGIAYNPKIKFSPSYDLTLATAHLLHGDWPAAFKASVHFDLKTIGLLGKALATGAEPAVRDIQRAKLAKEDLEFKLQWLAVASTRSKAPSARRSDPELLISKSLYYSIFGARHAAPSSSVADPIDPMVSVTVNTKGEGEIEVRGWRVYANAYAHGDDEGEAVTFSVLSTPTTERLPVGRYNMWATKGKNKSPLTPIGVGRANQRAQTVDLAVP
jgi:hypothetical protein